MVNPLEFVPTCPVSRVTGQVRFVGPSLLDLSARFFKNPLPHPRSEPVAPSRPDNQLEKHLKVQFSVRRGIPVFLVTTLWRWYDHGWHVPSHGELYFEMFFELVIWTGGGYWFGARMWKRVFEEPSREV